ncbi:hypothetical protein RST01_16700 [Rummeliibacillus stabekisii]|nr:hypothetical protein RST01_16700 [Rummeliibacillus stabekisii]
MLKSIQYVFNTVCIFDEVRADVNKDSIIQLTKNVRKGRTDENHKEANKIYWSHYFNRANHSTFLPYLDFAYKR